MKRTRLAPRSPKRLGEQGARWAVIAAVHLRDRTCRGESVVPEVECGGRLDVDEITPRGVRPGAHLEVDECQLLCRRHHDWKHAHAVEAERRGLRRWSWDR